MIALTNGRNRKCKSNIGGVKLIYLFPFIKYSRSQIIRTGLELTTFPSTTIYAFEGVNLSFTDSQSTEDGGKFFTENLTADFIGLELNTSFRKLVDDDYRVIVKDNNNKYRLLGAYNGLITEFNSTSGGNSSDFSGYNLTFDGKERQEALFIDDLEDAGFIISLDNFLLLEDGTPILTEGNEKIIIEE
jgi:hypothetical protein